MDQISLIIAWFFTAYLKGKNHVWSRGKSIVCYIFPEGQKSTFYVWQITYFGFCYKLSNFLTIIDGYYIWLSSDCTIWYNLTSQKDSLSTIFLVFYFHAITFTGGHARKFTHNWEVECCTVTITLPSNKTIGTLTSKSHPKGCISN